MATYDYQCYRCGHKLSVEMKIKDYKPDNEPVCPSCQQVRMNRIISNATVHIVGGPKKGKVDK